MLITAEVRECDAQYTTIYVAKTDEEFVLSTPHLQSKYPTPIQAGQSLGNFETTWLKHHHITKRIVNPERDAPVGYGDSW